MNPIVALDLALELSDRPGDGDRGQKDAHHSPRSDDLGGRFFAAAMRRAGHIHRNHRDQV